MCSWVWKKIKGQRRYLIGATSVFCLATNYLFLDAQNVSSEFFCTRGFCFQAALFSVVASSRCHRSDFTVSLRGELPLHLVRSLTGCGAFFFILKAAEMVDLDDIMNAMACVPALVAILSRVFLGETLNISELTANAAAIGGISYVGRPSAFYDNHDDDGDEVLGTIWAAVGCVCLALTYVLQRKIRRTRLEVTLLFNAAVGVAVLIPVTATMDSEVPDCVDVLSALVSGAFVVITLIFHVEVSRLRGTDQLKMLCAIHVPLTIVTEIFEFDELPWFACYVGVSAVGLCVLALWFLQEEGDGCTNDRRSLTQEDLENNDGEYGDSVECHGENANQNINDRKQGKNGGKDAKQKNSGELDADRVKRNEENKNRRKNDGKEMKLEKREGKDKKGKKNDRKDAVQSRYINIERDAEKKDLTLYQAAAETRSNKSSNETREPTSLAYVTCHRGNDGEIWKTSSNRNPLTRTGVFRVPESWTNYDLRTVQRETVL